MCTSGVAALSNICLQRQAMLLDVATYLLRIVRLHQRALLLLASGTDAAWSNNRFSTMGPREVCDIRLHRTRDFPVRSSHAVQHLPALAQECA
jgi:hypothetical protein